MSSERHPVADGVPATRSETLPAPQPASIPVFVDATGRRQRRVRRLTTTAGLAGLTYTALVAMSVIGGAATVAPRPSPDRPIVAVPRPELPPPVEKPHTRATPLAVPAAERGGRTAGDDRSAPPRRAVAPPRPPAPSRVPATRPEPAKPPADATSAEPARPEPEPDPTVPSRPEPTVPSRPEPELPLIGPILDRLDLLRPPPR